MMTILVKSDDVGSGRRAKACHGRLRADNSQWVKIVFKISHLKINEGETYFFTILICYLQMYHFNEMQVYTLSFAPFNFFSLPLSLPLSVANACRHQVNSFLRKKYKTLDEAEDDLGINYFFGGLGQNTACDWAQTSTGTNQ